jgi:hypothetical protein
VEHWVMTPVLQILPTRALAEKNPANKFFYLPANSALLATRMW